MRIIFIAFILMLFTVPAQADCTSPAGVEGKMLYNTTFKTMQFCDGTNWYSMKGGSASTIDGLSDVDTSGKSTNDVLMWDGTNWVDQAPSGGGSGAVVGGGRRRSGSSGGSNCRSSWIWGGAYCNGRDFLCPAGSTKHGTGSGPKDWLDERFYYSICVQN